jgi:Uma2 family endonuclease
VHLVIEVVSPESEIRDTLRKPTLYAAAGIKHFWRIEDNAGLATVFTYELDAVTRSYEVTGVHHETMRLTVPFPIELRVDTLHRRAPKLS